VRLKMTKETLTDASLYRNKVNHSSVGHCVEITKKDCDIFGLIVVSHAHGMENHRPGQDSSVGKSTMLQSYGVVVFLLRASSKSLTPNC